MKKLSSTRTYGLLAIWVMGATAIGIYITTILSKPKIQEFIAPMAEIRQCGPTAVASDQERKLVAEWVSQEGKIPSETKNAIARTIKSLPDGVLKALQNKHVKITLDRGESPYTCTVYDKSSDKSRQASIPLRSATNCLRTVGKDSIALVLGFSQHVAADGKPRAMTEKDVINETLLPVIFWTLFEGVYKATDAANRLEQDNPSISNISEQVKRYIVSGFKFSKEEQEFYLREFGAAGIETPAFASRTLVLTATNLYCSEESYARLSKSQSEATKRFMSIYGCALGKPWHMQDVDFSSICPNIALNK